MVHKEDGAGLSDVIPELWQESDCLYVYSIWRPNNKVTLSHTKNPHLSLDLGVMLMVFFQL